MQCTVEIVSIGNELLIGKTSNTNAQWLAQYITTLGGQVRRIDVIGDNLVEISSILRDALRRKTSIIITTGGLGPTFDDMTLEAIAGMLEIPLEVNEEALRIVKEKYLKKYELGSNIKSHLTPSRLKMITLPKGARALYNPVGTAPGVLLTVEMSKIIALPGVPAEMKAIFEGSVKPLIKGTVGKKFICEKSLKITQIGESTIAPLIEKTMRTHPHIYIKSHPRARALIELHLMTVTRSKNVGEKRIEAAIAKISKLILEKNGKIDLVQP